MERYGWIIPGAMIGWACCAALTRNTLHLGQAGSVGMTTDGLKYTPHREEGHVDPGSYGDKEWRDLKLVQGGPQGDDTPRRERMTEEHYQRKPCMPGPTTNCM